jgi:hypothetical protein
VGQPFEEAFIKAAVIHDHYCDRRVRPWRQTHQVCREALLKSAVEPVKAGIMYFAVLIGGPKWVRLIPGKPCPVGTGCINNVNISTSLPGNNIAVGADGDFYLVRQNRYASASFSDAMNRYTPEIEDLGDSITEEQIENIANEAMADDFYYRNEDEIGTGSPFNINNNMK